MKALVLSGGGSKGSWQAAVLKHLLGDLKNKYQILCGVSAGAINAAFVSQFEVGDEVEAAHQLTNLWSNLDNNKIYKRWFPFGRFHALWKPSLYDSQPLIDLLNEKIDIKKIRASGKEVRVGTVSLSSGKYTIFDQNSEHFINAVIASSSFPGMLKPIEFAGHLWSDGGSKESSPVKTAVDLEANTIDAVITSPELRVKHFLNNPNTADILKRAFDLSTDKIMANDIEKVYMYNKLAEKGDPDRRVVKLNIFRPKHNLIEDLLDFNPTKIKEMMEKGYQDAIDTCKSNNF